MTPEKKEEWDAVLNSPLDGSSSSAGKTFTDDQAADTFMAALQAQGGA